MSGEPSPSKKPRNKKQSQETERETLATFTANVTFTGIVQRKCMHMTSLCPDKCNHETRFARFDVDTHLDYDKPGQYGDDQEPTVGFGIKQVQHNSPEMAKALEELEVGDKIKMSWTHDYVTEKGCSKPQRFPTSITSVDDGLESKRQTLASFTAVAIFKGIQTRACMHKTSLCPDKCGHETKYARFDVVEHLEYTKPGKYGDAQQPCFGFGIGQVHSNSPKMAQDLEELTNGAKVKISWKHDYVTVDGSSGPQRYPVSIEDVEDSSEKRETLASFTAIATFKGIEERICMHKTSVCPDKCGHETKFARFDVVQHVEYNKPGKYGDAEKPTFGFGLKQVQQNAPEMAQALERLEAGAKVKISWRHDYVTIDNCSGPARFPTSIENAA